MIYFFGICIALLLFFSVLIQNMQAKGKKAAGELMARTVTFWWMLSLFAVALISPTWVFCLLLLACSLLSLAEYYSLVFPAEKSLVKIICAPIYLILGLGCIANFAFLYTAKVEYFFVLSTVLTGIVLPMFYVLKNRMDDFAKTLPSLALGFQFFAVLLAFSYPLYAVDVKVFLLVVFLTEIRDLVSYWVGKAFSKVKTQSLFLNRVLHSKVAENVSPNKTWFVGVISSAILYGVGFGLSQSVFELNSMDSIKLNLILVSIGVLGLFGDLVFSLVKRIFEQKDSGTWLPGNSGIIDRIDALVFTTPVAYFILILL